MIVYESFIDQDHSCLLYSLFRRSSFHLCMVDKAKLPRSPWAKGSEAQRAAVSSKSALCCWGSGDACGMSACCDMLAELLSC